MLQHMDGISDEAVVKKWVENPYWQYFCGYDFLQWQFPIHPSSMTRWRKRLGTEGLEKILNETLHVGVRSGHSQVSDFEEVIVDTTVMEKAITHPTDSKLLNKARKELVKLAQAHQVPLRQSYKRVGEEACHQAGRYAHARQFKRMNRENKRLKTYLGRVVRDIERKTQHADEAVKEAFAALLEKSRRLLLQKKDSKNKLYSLHAPETECIGKGKAHKTYEFGCKVSLVVTHKKGLAVSSQALHGNPFDGHTLAGALESAQATSGITIKRAFVDRGYKGHGVDSSAVYVSGTRRLPPKLKKALRRRSAIEPHIGHMKNDGKLGRNYLKGQLGDCLNALLCAIGHNLRLALAFIMLIFTWLLEALFSLSLYKRIASFQSDPLTAHCS